MPRFGSGSPKGNPVNRCFSIWLGSIMSADGGDCETVLARFGEAGVNLEALAAQLQVEGAKAFVKSWNDLLSVIASKSNALKKGELQANSAT
jgi:transaldolase